MKFFREHFKGKIVLNMNVCLYVIILIADMLKVN